MTVHREPRTGHARRRLALGAAVLLTGALLACGGSPPQQVTGWVTEYAAPLDGVDPAAPLDDLAPLRRSIGDAEIVGLGESVHGAAQEITLKHRVLRLLVEQLGFRSIAWEEDWSTGLLINDYLRTGVGDLGSLVARMSPQWHSTEVADVLRWLRDFNAGRADPVQFVGVEYYLTQSPAYDSVEAYVAAAAPERLPELREHLQVIRPTAADPFAHIGWYTGVADKSPYIGHARQVHDLIDGLAHEPGDRDHALAVQTARQIVSFYKHYDLTDAEALVYRDAHAAENLRWWQEFTGDRVAYWAASAHTADAPSLRIAAPPDPDWRFPSAGSYLRQWYGERYLSIGFTLGQGTVGAGPGKTVALPEPAAGWFERRLGEVRLDQFALDLRASAPPPVRQWLEAPVTTRGLPDRGPDSYLAAGSLAQWFDVVIHRQDVTPVQST